MAGWEIQEREIINLGFPPWLMRRLILVIFNLRKMKNSRDPCHLSITLDSLSNTQIRLDDFWGGQ